MTETIKLTANQAPRVFDLEGDNLQDTNTVSSYETTNSSALSNTVNRPGVTYNSARLQQLRSFTESLGTSNIVINELYAAHKRQLLARAEAGDATNGNQNFSNWIQAILSAKSEINQMSSIYDQQISNLVNLQRSEAQATSECIKSNMNQMAAQTNQEAAQCNWAIAGAAITLGCMATIIILPMCNKLFGTSPEYFDRIKEEIDKTDKVEHPLPENEQETEALVNDPAVQDALNNHTFRFKLDPTKNIDDAIKVVQEAKQKSQNPEVYEQLEKELKNPTLKAPLDVPVTKEKVEQARRQVRKNDRTWFGKGKRNTYFKEAQTPEHLAEFKIINNERKAFYERREAYIQKSAQSMGKVLSLGDPINSLVDGTAGVVINNNIIGIKGIQKDVNITQTATSFSEGLYKSSAKQQQDDLKDLLDQLDAVQQDFSIAQNNLAG